MISKLNVLFVIGARPNYMKLAPLWSYYKNYVIKTHPNIMAQILHTNQHVDVAMSKTLLQQLGIAEIHHNLYDIKALENSEQSWTPGLSLDKLILFFRNFKPNWVVVIGDVNSTFLAALGAKYLNINVAHIEAGLRSFDRAMPEEINRLATDAIADLFFTTAEGAAKHLINEGVSGDKIFNIGNLMIDTLLQYYKNGSNDQNKSHGAALVTLHRPSNVDNPERLHQICMDLISISKKIPILFPIHPRTKSNLIKFNLEKYLNNENITLLPPVDYFDMINLYQRCLFVLTDSGGIQEETTALQIPCLTLRENTERPITIEIGSSTLVGSDSKLLIENVDCILKGNYKKGNIPPLWDGAAAARFWQYFLQRL